MKLRKSVVPCAAILSLAILTSAATHRAADATRTGKTSLQPAAKPQQLPIDADQHVDKILDHGVKDFIVNELAGQFAAPHKFYLASKVDATCALMISVAKKSSGIDKKYDAANINGFIIALITNPNDCKPDAFDLDPRDTAAWFVRYKNLAVTGNPGQRQDGVPGRSGLVLLQRYWWKDNDYWFPKKKSWALGYCNHDPALTPMDKALVLTRASVCTATEQYMHDVDVISARQLDEAVALSTSQHKGSAPAIARILVADTDLTLWFACGGDCCYANFQ